MPKTPLTPNNLTSHVNPNTNSNSSTLKSTLISKLDNNNLNNNDNTESSTIFIKRSPISSPSRKTPIATSSDRDSELFVTTHTNDHPKIVINSNMSGINKYSFSNPSSISEQLKMTLQYKQQQQQQQQQQQTVKILKGSYIQNKFGIASPHISSSSSASKYSSRSKSTERSRTTPRSRDKNTTLTTNQRITPLISAPMIQGQSIITDKRNITFQSQYRVNNYNPLLAYRNYNGFSGLK